MACAHSIQKRLGQQVTEEQLLGEIAYYKARLADIRRAPPASRHREVLHEVSDNLQRREEMLERLRGCSDCCR
jgi:hypothetical protein